MNDQGCVLTSTYITVGTADAVPSVTGLTAGDYVWDGTHFTKNGVPNSGGTVTGTMNIGDEIVKDLLSNQNGMGWSWDAPTATLTLNSSYTGAPISVNCQNENTVNLVYTGDVSITSSTTSTIYCNGSLNIIGSGGTLTVNSTSSDSLYCAIAVNRALTIGGNAYVNATCAGSGTSPAATVIYAKNGVTVSDSANLTTNATGTDASGIWVEFGDITISTTGTVTAGGTGTGGGLSLLNGRKLNMSGGTIVLSSNPLYSTQFAELNITGGNITIDGTPVYRALLSLSDVNISTMVTAVSVTSSSYGISSESTSADGKLCFLLPEGSQTVTLTADGKTYTGTVNVTTNNAATGTHVSGGTSTYAVNVTNGTATPTTAAAGATITITANAAPSGQRFKEWTITPSVTFTDATGKTSQTTTFIMPAGVVTATATYEVIPTGTVSVTGVSLNNSILFLYSNTAPDTATLTAMVTPNDATNKAVTWASGNTVVATVDQSGNVKAVGNGTTVITAATNDGGYTASCTITVSTYSSGGGGGSSSGGSNETPDVTTPEIKPNQPVTASTHITATAGKNGTAKAAITDKTIAKAQADAKAQGNSTNGISVELNVTMPKGATSLTVTLTQGSTKSLVSKGVTDLQIKGAPASLRLDLNALKEIQKQGDGNISIGIAPATGLSNEAKALIGKRPVYNITISTTKGGKLTKVTNLGTGTATLSIPYTPGKNEAMGYLFGVYVDAKGKAIRIDGSAYDANAKAILLTVRHFSVYGVGYTAPSAKFNDISTHWGKESIDYVVGRGLISGTKETTFAPDTAMTRGMLVTALGRLAGVDVKAYSESSFTDVKADNAFGPYIEWACKKGIVQAIGNQQFAPDRGITREEISVIFANYAKATGYKLPVTRVATDYADASSIDSVYKVAITAMQQAGIMMGGTGNKFNPKSSATRAEVSSMLHRYIKLTIDPATSQGWALNDAGQYLYYKDSKALIGWQDISSGDAKITYYFDTNGVMVSGKWFQNDGKWYYFYADGALAKGTKVDAYEVDENGVRKQNNYRF